MEVIARGSRINVRSASITSMVRALCGPEGGGDHRSGTIEQDPGLSDPCLDELAAEIVSRERPQQRYALRLEKKASGCR
jgi:hypothetical protein